MQTVETGFPRYQADPALGELRDSFHPKRLGKGIMISNWVMIVLAAAMVVTIPVAVWFLVLVLRTPNYSAKARAKRVDLYDQGIVLVESTGPVAAFRFDSMSLLQAIVVNRVYGVKTGTAHLLTMTGLDGQTHKASQFYERIDELGAAVQNGIVHFQLQPLTAAVWAGQAVPFGDLVLHRGGITTPKRQIAWAELTGLDLRAGSLFICVQGKRLAVFNQQLSRIPNYRLLLAAAGQLSSAG